MNRSKLQRIFFWLRYTPLHPQWFAFLHERRRHCKVGQIAKGHVLDIGCGRKPIRNYLSDSCRYTSVDYPATGAELYAATPDVFADADSLPFPAEKFDTVLLLEVLEHLPKPTHAVVEARRVLKPGGVLIVSTPFLYPVHDAPHDYQRWTKYGLTELLQADDADIVFSASGGSTETAALLLAISMAASMVKAIEKRNVAILAIPVLLAGIVFSNIVFWILSKVSVDSDLMSIGYLAVAKKNRQ